MTLPPSSPQEPKPVSSDEEGDDDDNDEDMLYDSGASGSRLFAPYRTLGIVATGAPFTLVSHLDTTHVCLPIGERFQLMNERLQPVLVSRSVGNTISHVVTDSSMSITVTVDDDNRVTLLARTQPIHSKQFTGYKTVGLLHLGRTTHEVTGEKMAICAAVMARKDDDKESMDDDDDGEGQVVLLLASRTTLFLHKRIPIPSDFQPSIAVHPPTYLNKILLGGSVETKNGTTAAALLLLNIRTAKVIHRFTCLGDDLNDDVVMADSDDANTRVTALEASPAVDTVAVGTLDGKVHLINLRLDRKLFSLAHRSSATPHPMITSMSFRTDASALRQGIAPLAVGRSDGIVSVWDLKEKSILWETTLHRGGISKLQYLAQEPVLLSTGRTTNAITMHVFDNPDHSGRLLRQRKGHEAPPQRIRYLHTANILAQAADGTDAAACQILSGGSQDRSLRCFSTVRSVLDKEFSQGQGLEKRAKKYGLDSTAELLLPPITDMTTAEARRRDWGDLATIHENHAFAYVWSSQRGVQSGPVLRQTTWNVSAMKEQPPPSCHATAVTMSSCGSFCLVGSRGGLIYKYNVQSGIPRGSYPKQDASETESRRSMAGDIRRTMKTLEKAMKVSNRPADMDKLDRDAVQESKQEERRLAKLDLASHTASVVGLAVDSVNKTLISVGADAKLILWNFKTHAPHKKSPYRLPCPASRLCHVRDSDLAAIALEDYTVVLFDCVMLSIVRRFGAKENRHKGPINDLCFNPDGRTLFTSSLDGTVRVWDVPTNSCLDWMTFQTAPTSLTMSPTGEFLATTHAGKLGIHLWTDRSFFQTVDVDGAHPPMEPARMDEPAPVAETSGDAKDRKKKAFPPVDGSTSKTSLKNDAKADNDSKLPAVPKEDGLITLSGLPATHWKNLFHLELVKERNKPSEPPKKPPTAPFFLQWRGGESLGGETNKQPEVIEQKDEDAEWKAAWSDEDTGKMIESAGSAKDSQSEKSDTASLQVDDNVGEAADGEIVATEVAKPKRRKITHHRSHFASLLHSCSQKKKTSSSLQFQDVSDHIATLGPSAIDIALSSLCNGMHDLEEGLPLLSLACSWLLEALQSRERYEAVNAYLHRFLYLHATVIAGIDDGTYDRDGGDEDGGDDNKASTKYIQQQKSLLHLISQLRQAQQVSSEALSNKMQQTLCLLRHFSRMV